MPFNVRDTDRYASNDATVRSRTNRRPPRQHYEPRARPAPRVAPRTSRRDPPPPASEGSRQESDAFSNRLESSGENTQNEDSEDDLNEPNGLPHSKSMRQPLRIVDWRGEMCRLLHLENSTSDAVVLEEVEKTEIILQEAQRNRTEAFESEDLPPRGQIIYRISCHETRARQELYLEEPWVSRSGPNGSHLRAGDAIRNFELHLERNKDISFIIYKDFDCCGGSLASGPWRGLYDDPESPIAGHFVSELIQIISMDLDYALHGLSQEPLSDIRHPDLDIRGKDPITYPYLWWYHRRNEISIYEDTLERNSHEHVEIFKAYLLQRLGKDWEVVDNLVADGFITSQYLEYLFIPGEVMVSTLDGEGNARIQGAAADGWLNVYRYSPASNDRAPQAPTAHIPSLQLSFDGNFEWENRTLLIKNIPSKRDQKIKITGLDLYPARFADPAVIRVLEQRGQMFWKCRKRNYVCYNDTIEDTMHMAAAQRFMVDIAIFKEMHTPDAKTPPKRDDIGSDAMLLEEPPSESGFVLCLPTTIPGFNMQKKEWVTLEVDTIKDVEWNRDAFEMLVADEETKELVRALVENHCNAEKNTDLISGKGNGLFVLLHGAPGTGKTLTAETVAEIAEKPLYRVTCGDIGTKAEDVEKYLETVLLLGKTWGCVVLLDEADVFLEERTLYDLQRNALVSVFLRVLEYYEGILILTSNRVGTFDEAFKSRIQLTLRYKNLEEPQRKKIWKNLIARLEDHQINRPRQATLRNNKGFQEQDIDFKNILANLDDLARVELNGREIRNAVSTARQLAMFRGMSMDFSHLKVVINESEKFDAYLKEVTGVSPDLAQRDKGLR